MTVRRSLEGAVGTLTLDRPQALNALNAEVIASLAEGFAAFAAEPACRVVILTGAGEKAFAAGADIKEFEALGPIEAEALARRTQAVHGAIRDCGKPVIAAVNGLCLGGGFELALACDIRIAATSARFGLPEVKLGIVPGAGGIMRLARIAGAGIARAMALSGRPIDAQQALASGIVTELAEPAALADRARELAEAIAANGPYALAQVKALAESALEAGLETGLREEARALALCFATEDRREGVAAFVERRRPAFKGR